MQNNNLIVSMSPHLRGTHSIEWMMHTFIIGLIPPAVMALYLFGIQSLVIMALSMATAVIVEAAIQRLTNQQLTYKDCHAILTGLMLALILPPSVPWWIPVVGASVAIILGKLVFGGLGNYPFNPPLVAWVVLKLSWPERMSLFFAPHTHSQALTPLMAFKEDPSLFYSYDMIDLFLGNIPGPLGTVCGLAVLIGAVFILYRGVIRWHIPISFLFGVGLFAGILHAINPDVYPPAIFHLLSGGLLLGAFFIAPEPVTSPVTPKGMLLFGTLAGILTMIIRMWGAYPDGAFYAILIMNTATPLFNYLKPRKYGRLKRA
ncbi:MAG: RnfABCDGE type electron transport complex subunit D [Euryarchaeota archaeon]|nr:RnfABCDGE type electron transport complex subunit D [Euryarchaeota archaeon]